MSIYSFKTVKGVQVLDAKKTAKDIWRKRYIDFVGQCVMNVDVQARTEMKLATGYSNISPDDVENLGKEVVKFIRSQARKKKAVSIGKGYYDITEIVADMRNEKLKAAYDALCEIETLSDGVQHALTDILAAMRGEVFNYETGEFSPIK